MRPEMLERRMRFLICRRPIFRGVKIPGLLSGMGASSQQESEKQSLTVNIYHFAKKEKPVLRTPLTPTAALSEHSSRARSARRPAAREPARAGCPRLVYLQLEGLDRGAVA